MEVYESRVQRGQAGERWAGAVKTTQAQEGRQQKLPLPMGGDDGATDIAVGGHGIQLPPGRPKMTGRKKGELPPPSLELLKQSYQHTSPFNFLKLNHLQPPLPYSPTGFNNHTPPTTKSNTTHSSTCKLKWISCLCLHFYIRVPPYTMRKPSLYTCQQTSKPTFSPLLRYSQEAPPPPPPKNKLNSHSSKALTQLSYPPRGLPHTSHQIQIKFLPFWQYCHSTKIH